MTKKYEELYRLAKEDFSSEIERLSRIERKATTLLSAVTLLVGVYGLVAKWALSQVLPPQDKFSVIVLSLSVLVFVGLITSWVFLFRVLKIDKRTTIAVDQPIVDFYDKNMLINIYYAMSKRIGEGASYNRDLGSIKTKRLTQGYKLLMTTGVFLALFALSSAGYAWYKNNDALGQMAQSKGIEMSDTKDDENKPDQSQTNNDTNQELDRDIEAPKLQYIRESYDPEKDSEHSKK